MSHKTPEIERSKRFNLFTSIWIVPLIALFVAGWLAYQYYAQKGPEIQIIFEKNEGLIAGQSQVKYRNVPVGLVNKVELEEDGEGVVVTAQMNKDATLFLNDEAKFWIVKPEVGLGGVSGLDTLISGTYIQMYAQKDAGETKYHFHGLSHAYRDDSGGEYFVLNMQKGDSSVKKGTPIYLQNIKVGQVEYVLLGLDHVSVDVIVFIDKPYVPYVHTTSKFWIRNTLNATFNHGSLDVQVAPLFDLVQGAIEFSSDGKDSQREVPNTFVFQLFGSKNEILRQRIGNGMRHMEYFMLHVDHPVAGLRPGAPVRFEGFDIGSVQDVVLEYEPVMHRIHGDVRIEVDTSVFASINDVNDTGIEHFYHAIKDGLQAHIKELNPVTGSLYVDLIFDQNASMKNILETFKDSYTYIPTVDYVPTDMMAAVSEILNKINNLPLEELLASVEEVVQESKAPVEHADELLLSLKKSMDNLNKLTSKKSFVRMPDEVDKALKALRGTLYATKKTMKNYQGDSLMMKQLSDTMRSVKESSDEMTHFLKMLNRKPNSLIFGDK